MTFDVQECKASEKIVYNINILLDFSPLFFSWQYMADYGIRKIHQYSLVDPYQIMEGLGDLTKWNYVRFETLFLANKMGRPNPQWLGKGKHGVICQTYKSHRWSRKSFSDFL